MTIYISSKPAPYVYRLDHPLTGEFYIGSRWKNYTKLNLPSSQDIGFKYFTSSKTIKPRFNEFNITIVAEFFDADSAYDFEQLLIFESWKFHGSLNKHCTHGKTRFCINGPKSGPRAKGMPTTGKKAKGMPNVGKKAKGIPNTGLHAKGVPRAHQTGKGAKGMPKGPNSTEHNLKISVATKCVKKPVVTCPHCNKTGGVSVMQRWHFDNCRMGQL